MKIGKPTPDNLPERVRTLTHATGYWNKGAHELLLIGTRGHVPAPAFGTQWSSVIEAEKGAHSVKPDKALEMIESYYPNLPKIELKSIGRRSGAGFLARRLTSSLRP